ncbi:hypothetical protein FBY35_6013 [Streptomyces sp. SLBN-118]|nr:hypothetical protein FBY35_6013 [Streptomyces sp. SLBN-118]
MLLVMVTAANVTDRDAAKELLFRLALMHPEIAIVGADSAYAGKLVTKGQRPTSISPSRRCAARRTRRASWSYRAGG